MSGTAQIDGDYRYTLTRDLGPGLPGQGERVLFIMLNPSTATAETDDPTIRRCKGFAGAWACRFLEVVNLYALRTPNPRDMFARRAAGIDIIGPGNDAAILSACTRAQIAVAAWGANAEESRAAEVCQLVSASGRRLLCLGSTKDGAPRHPLYVRSSVKPEPYAGPARAHSTKEEK